MIQEQEGADNSPRPSGRLHGRLTWTQGIRTTALPKAVIAHTLRDRVAPVEIELEAYSKGSRTLLTHLVMTDKWMTSRQQAEGLIDEVFGLPYHAELREHYR